ncbi:hypothetical protein D3C83_156110 [compost metagenome]
MICCFQRSVSGGMMMRAFASLLPPTGKGITKRMVFAGKVCAHAAGAETNAAATNAARSASCIVSSSFCDCATTG